MTVAMDPFADHPQTRFIVGDDRIDALGALARELGARKALVVSDPGIVAVGHTARGCASLTKSGIAVEVFSAIQENPTTEHVDRGVEIAKSYQPDLIVGLGGGSSMDCAKGINFIYTNGGVMQDYWGIGKATKPMLPMIAVPTTAGTGSEAQSFALISDPVTHAKMACGDKKAAFRVAILDPKLTLTKPPWVTAVTGLDAIAHAVETFVCNKRNELSNRFALRAWNQLTAGFLTVIRSPQDLTARRQMQLGACFAGMAIENSMLGAAHATANPLTANYDLVHGSAVALMLPHVVRFNAEAVDDEYNTLARAIRQEGGAVALADYLTSLVAASGLKTRLSEFENVRRADLPGLAQQAAQQWTTRFNPRAVDETALLALYEAAY
jgi:alcohol dehydrogenase